MDHNMKILKYSMPGFGKSVLQYPNRSKNHFNTQCLNSSLSHSRAQQAWYFFLHVSGAMFALYETFSMLDT